MMRNHVELIMPPTPFGELEDPKPPEVISLLAPLSKDAALRGDITTAEYLHDRFYIGGRFSGTKTYLRLDPERLRQFWEELAGEAFNTDLGSDVFGRDRMWGIEYFGELDTGSDGFDQYRMWSWRDLPKVDALWRKWFPEDEVGEFPLSPYYPTGAWDICRVDRIPDSLTAYAVVVANEDKVVFQLRTEIFDPIGGYQSTDFDGSVRNALRRCRACGVEPAPDWLAVTLECCGG